MKEILKIRYNKNKKRWTHSYKNSKNYLISSKSTWAIKRKYSKNDIINSLIYTKIIALYMKIVNNLFIFLNKK